MRSFTYGLVTLEKLVEKAKKTLLVEDQADSLWDHMVYFCQHALYSGENEGLRFERLERFGMYPSGSGLIALVNVKQLARNLKKTESWIQDLFKVRKYEPVEASDRLYELFRDLYDPFILPLRFPEGWQYYEIEPPRKK